VEILDERVSSTLTALDVSTEMDWDRTESAEVRVETDVEILEDKTPSTLTARTVSSEIATDKLESTEDSVERDVEIDELSRVSTLVARKTSVDTSYLTEATDEFVVDRYDRTFAAKLASSDSAAASSFKVSSVSGAPSIKSVNLWSTYCLVTACVGPKLVFIKLTL